VCIYAINVSRGTKNPLLNCATLAVSNSLFLPVGHLDSVRRERAEALVEGWSLDPDTLSQSLAVHLYIDGRFQRQVTSDEHGPTSLLSSRERATGTASRTPLTTARGSHCVRLRHQRRCRLGNPSLGCATAEITQRAWEPIGNLEAATPRSGGRVDLVGWAWDPDAGLSSSPVHLYVDGRMRGRSRPRRTAPTSEPPTRQRVQGTASRRLWTVGSGVHTVCAFGINVGLASPTPCWPVAR
jgi:hypothetical protein